MVVMRIAKDKAMSEGSNALEAEAERARVLTVEREAEGARRDEEVLLGAIRCY